MLSSTTVSNLVRLSIVILLVNIVLGLDAVSDDNRRLYQLLKQRSADNDNEYVWFTRDVHEALDDDRDTLKRPALDNYEYLRRAKNNRPAVHRPYPSLDIAMPEAD